MPAYIPPRRVVSAASNITVAASTSLIARAVNGLGEFAGLGPMADNSWRQLTGVQNQDAVLWNGSPAGSTVLAQFGGGWWNPVADVANGVKRIEGVGSGHAAPDCRYWQYIDGGPQDGQFVFAINVQAQGVAVSHGMDHSTGNRYTGDFYHRDGVAGGQPLHFWRKTNNGSTFARIADLWPTGVDSNGVACGTTWVDAGFMGVGAQGAYACYFSGNNNTFNPNGWNISLFDPLANAGAGAWVYSQAGKTPGFNVGDSYHGIAEYSPQKNLLIYGGGNLNAYGLWRMDTSGAVARFTAPIPFGIGVGIQNPYPDAPQGKPCINPRNGNLLLFSLGPNLTYELDPSNSANTWVARTAFPSSTPGVNVPGMWGSASTSHSFTSIPEYGVVFLAMMPTLSGGTCWLYRPAP